MKGTPAGKSGRLPGPAGGKRRRPGKRAEDLGQKDDRLGIELLLTLSDDELVGRLLGPQLLFRINGEGLPEAVLVFDPVTGVKQKLRFPIAGGEAA